MTGTSQVAMEKKVAIRLNKPIEACGLTFYPITMANYEDFVACKDAWTLRLGTLPVKFQTKDFLSAIFALEQDANRSEATLGLFQRVLKMLHLSLRIGCDISMQNLQIYTRTQHSEVVLSHLVINQDGKIVKIVPRDFSFVIRPLIAEQNGLELPNEQDNIELVRDAELKKALQSSNIKLKENTDDLIASVAYLSGITESDINSWTVREFGNRIRAIERDKRYMMCGQAEMSGMVSFKNGNPAPSWCFDILDETLGTVPVAQLQLEKAAQAKY